MPAPPSLPAALLQRAEADPEEPWLFRSEGWDWKWHPWGELAGWLESWAERLLIHPPGSRAAFLDRSDPESVILDLALQAAGLVSVPVRERGDEPLWIDPGPPGPASGRSLDREAGGAAVRTAVRTEEWTAADLVAAGEKLREVIQPQKKREIAVLGGPLQDPAERAMLAWATLVGAAVVLEPDPALRAATATWVRPTVFHGSPEQIAELRRSVKVRKGRLPFRRLRTVLATGELAAEDQAFWREQGVSVFTPFAAERHDRGI